MSAKEESPAVAAAEGGSGVLLYEKFDCNMYSEWTWQWALRALGEGKYRVVFRCKTDCPPKPRPRTCSFRKGGKLLKWICEVWEGLNEEPLPLSEILEIGANLAAVDEGVGLEFNKAAINETRIGYGMGGWADPRASVDRVAIIMGGVKWLGSEPRGSFASMRWGIINAAIRQYIRNFLNAGQPAPTGEQQVDMTSGNPWEGDFASPVGGKQHVSGPVYIAPEAVEAAVKAVEAAAKAVRAREGYEYRIEASALGRGGKPLEGYPAVWICHGLDEARAVYHREEQHLVDLLVDYIAKASISHGRTKDPCHVSLRVDPDEERRGFELRWEADRSRLGTLHVGMIDETEIEFEEVEGWE